MPATTAPPPLTTELVVSVVGAGLMGHAIAGVFAAARSRVRLSDPNSEVLHAAPDHIRDHLSRLGHDPALTERVELHTDLQRSIDGADLVIEAVPENLDLKQRLFAELDRSLPPTTVLATNTSVYRISAVAADTAHPERVVGTHWFNPPHLVPLVEVIQGDHTDPKLITWTLEVLRAAGKVPVRVQRDVPGFIGNRLQHALWREAIGLIEDGVCDAATIDLVVRNSFGPRLAVMGPMENADYVGLDLVVAVHDYVFPGLHRDQQAAALIRELVEAGHLGAKTGHGIADWSPQQRLDAARRLENHLIAAFHDQSTSRGTPGRLPYPDAERSSAHHAGSEGDARCAKQ